MDNHTFIIELYSTYDTRLIRGGGGAILIDKGKIGHNSALPGYFPYGDDYETPSMIH